MIPRSGDDHALLMDTRYLQAIDLFNSSQWYAAHDLFEELWHEFHGPLRAMLQGIIQISVAEYHLENGNIRGSTLLMAEGLNHLQSFRSYALCFDLESLILCASSRLQALQADASLEGLPPPTLLQRNPTA